MGISLVCCLGFSISRHPLAIIDPEFAKRQLIRFTREWYMHPNGQLPAYEWALGDVNPPVHAWAAWRVYNIEQKFTDVAIAGFWNGCFKSYYSISLGG